MSSPKNRANRARAAAAHRTPTSPGSRRSLVPILVVVAVIVIAAGIALAVSGDDGDNGDGSTQLATAGVTVRGDALPEMPDGGQDPAVGQPAPTLEGVATDGTPTTVDFDGEEPTLLAFLAHWCPHCQAELPNLVTMADDGALDHVRPVVVLTGTDESAPNYPPAEWIEREGWEGAVLVDDDTTPAGQAYGLTGYPFLVLVDADGTVLGRASGALGLEGLMDFVEPAR